MIRTPIKQAVEWKVRVFFCFFRGSDAVFVVVLSSARGVAFVEAPKHMSCVQKFTDVYCLLTFKQPYSMFGFGIVKSRNVLANDMFYSYNIQRYDCFRKS